MTDRPAKTPHAGGVVQVDPGFGAGQVGEGADPVSRPDGGWTVISWDADEAVSTRTPPDGSPCGSRLQRHPHGR